MTRFLRMPGLLAIMFLCCALRSEAITLTGHLAFTFGCDSIGVRVTASAYSAGMQLRTYFGDGSVQTDTFFSNLPVRCYALHRYASSGTYTIKHVLLVGGLAVDSMSYADTIGICRSMHLYSYVDRNSNCIFDGGDSYLPNPYTMAVDSAGIPIDTLTGISFHYTASSTAPPGTVYTFRVMVNPVNYHVACPVSGRVYDTLGTGNGQHRMGFVCDSAGFDLGVYGWFSGGVSGGCAHVYVHNYRCSPQAATVTLQYSPKYTYSHVYPASITATTGAGYVTFNLGSVATNAGLIAYFTPVGTPSVGDTTHTTWTVNPISGDAYTPNNVFSRVDSIRTAYDPNDKAVTPQGDIPAGTLLEYKIGFENLGSDTAFNIHIQDTLSDYLDANTLRLTSASAEVYQQITASGGHQVLKFDLPHINLLDTTHPGQNTGMIVFSIRTKTALPFGTVISNRAGIYFDANPVIMTNTVLNTIGTPQGISVMSGAPAVQAFPNPVKDQLNLHIARGAFATVQLINMMGVQVLQQPILQPEKTIDVRSLPAGMYFILLKGNSDSRVLKIQKL